MKQLTEAKLRQASITSAIFVTENVLGLNVFSSQTAILEAKINYFRIVHLTGLLKGTDGIAEEQTRS